MTMGGRTSPLDRALQREMLLAMRKAFPDHFRYTEEFDARFELDTVTANLLYLREHGLCDVVVQREMSGGVAVGSPIITARGLDFLEDDGGLSAILGVVTVRLHADTIRDLIDAKIATSPIPETEKSALRRHLASLSETALRAATTDLVRSGLDHLPDAIHWLRTLGAL